MGPLTSGDATADRRIRTIVAVVTLLLVHHSIGARMWDGPIGPEDTSQLIIKIAHGLGAAALSAGALFMGLAAALGTGPARMIRSVRRLRGTWAALAGLFIAMAIVGIIWPVDFDTIRSLLEASPLADKVIEETEDGGFTLSYIFLFLNNFGMSSVSFTLPGLMLYLVARALHWRRPMAERGRLAHAAVALMAAAACFMPLLSMVVNGYVVGSVVAGDEDLPFPMTIPLLVPHGVLELPGVFLVAAVFVTLWRTLFWLLIDKDAAEGPRDVAVRLAPAYLCAFVMLLTAAIVEVEATEYIFHIIS